MPAIRAQVIAEVAQRIPAAVKALHRVTLKVPCPEDREIALAVLEAALPDLIEQELKP